MKKNYKLFLIGLSLFSLLAKAQVSGIYTFTQFSGAFTAVSGGTLFGSTTSDDQVFVDPSVPLGTTSGATGPGIPIGFTFMFNNTLFNRIGINNNGWIMFGQSALGNAAINSNSSSGYTGISATSSAPAALQNRVAGLARDIQGQAGSTLRVETIGTAPSRTCVIQWITYRKFAATGDDMSFQIRLLETTNAIQVIYGNFVNNATAGVAEVGLRGTTNGDYNNRVTNATNIWNNSIAGTSNIASVNFNNTGLVPATGQVYQWTPPQCSGTMTNQVAVAAPTLVCPNANANISVFGTSSLSGMTYTWYESTMSAVGLWTVVPGADGPVYTTPSISLTTWYQAVITCINSSSTGTTTAAQVQVAATTTSAVPYYEDFEGVTVNDRLPNCSWLASGLGTTFQTYTSSNTNNRVPRSGNKFGAFAAPTGTAYVYTNGIQMQPGITYSAAVWYQTDLTGANNWSNFALMVGDAQVVANQTVLAQQSPAISASYKLMSSTFTVASPGLYYVGFRGIGLSGTATHLMIDDISVTIPCTPQSGNNPTVSVQTTNTMACLGQPVFVTATGAHLYNWSNAGSGSTGTFVPGSLGTNSLVIQGTNTLTGCQGLGSLLLNVQAPPMLNGSANPAIVCSGKQVVITVSGADTYNWLHGPSGPQVIVTPTANTLYVVIGTGVNNCTSTASFPVNVNALPTVTIGVSRSSICVGEQVTLMAGIAGGALSYIWIGNINSNIMQGSNVTISPSSSDTYTVTGKDLNGCEDTEVATVAVDPCLGIAVNQQANKLRVFPNPGTGRFTIELGTPGSNVVEVWDVSGRLMRSMNVSEGLSELNLSDLAAGVYHVKAISAQNTEAIMLIKE